MDEDELFGGDGDIGENIFHGIEDDNNPSFSSFLEQSKTINPYQPHINHGAIAEEDQAPSGGKANDYEQGFNTTSPHFNINDSLTISSRILQILNDQETVIRIDSANRAPGSSVILYAIQLHPYEISVKRRYSEFDSLRGCLMKLFPSIIVPSIPEKHSFFNYIINPININKDIEMIESRKRLLSGFLNECKDIVQIRSCELFTKFLDPNEVNWNSVISSPPMTYLPYSSLLCDPIDPTNQNGLYSLLPIPYQQASSSSSSNYNKKINGEIPEFLTNFEQNFKLNIKFLTDLDKLNSINLRNFNKLIDTLVELGGNLNNFSLQITGINQEIEKFGSTIDKYFLNFEAFNINNNVKFKEPIHQFILNYKSCLQILNFYKLKVLQVKILTNSISKKERTVKLLKQDKIQAERLETALREGAKTSPTIAEAVRRYETKKQRENLGWYSVFGGSKKSTRYNVLPQSTSSLHDGQEDDDNDIQSTYSTTDSLKINMQEKEIDRLEKEILKIQQLLDLLNNDMENLTRELGINFNNEITKIKKKWLGIMLNYVKRARILSQENLSCWTELKDDINQL